MMNDHLSELQVQQYVLEPGTCEAGIGEHIHICEDCKARVAAYRVVFTGISEQPVPVFDFDIAALIVPQLEKAKPVSASNRFFIIMTLLMVISLSAAAYSFRGYLEKFFANTLSWFIGITVITAIGIMIFQGIELYRKYHSQMHQLEFE